MGYTHYFGINIPKGKAKEVEALYQRAILDCQRTVRAYYKEYGGLSGYTAHAPAKLYGGLLVNGKQEDAYEPFIMREHAKENASGFCKTARKPYDTAVVACLAILKHRLGNYFNVSSDGRADDWSDGVAYARKVTKLAINNPIRGTNEEEQT